MQSRVIGLKYSQNIAIENGVGGGRKHETEK